MTTTSEEARRTAPLAFWRYAHDYLQAAASFCRDDRTLCGESQVPYHVVAQALEFALHARLRAHGMAVADLRTRCGHSLAEAIALCEAHGMPPLPQRWHPAIRALAECHQEHGFIYAVMVEDTYPDIAPLVEAGVWILDQAAPLVAAHYVEHLGRDGSPTVEEFVHRLRTALCTISGGEVPPLPHMAARKRGSGHRVEAPRRR